MRTSKLQGTSTTSVQKPNGAIVEENAKLEVSEVLTEPVAHVGMKVGMTKNLGNFESARIDVSCYIPCKPEQKAIDEAYTFVNAWVDKKLSALLEDIAAAKT